MNLWEETMDDLKERGYTWDDVEWVGTRKGIISKELFRILAQNTEYDSGYGAQEIARDLLLVGDGWWAERNEYDGAEHWSFNRPIEKPNKFIYPEKLTGMWNSLDEIMKKEGDDA